MLTSKNKSAIFGLMMFLIMFSFSNAIFAQGFIIPRPIPSFPPAMPKLTEHKVNVKIVDQVTTVEVQQVFYNESDRPMEGSYYFPLPKDASVSDFKMYADGKVLAGELLEKEKARQIYEDIVRRNIDPALLEYVDHNLFSAKIFPIPPKKERKIVLEYALLLKLDGDLVQFSYPLRGELRSERAFVRPPHPPMPEPPQVIPLENGNQKSDSQAETKRTTDISQVIFIDLNSKVPLKTIYSPSHQVDISRSDDHHAKISYERKRKESEDNFVLYYSFSQSDFGLNLLTYRPEEKDDGFFMLLISPKTEIARADVIQKDLVFILDVSGSMEGEKIKQAKDALTYCINHLDRNDRFNVITFSTETKLFKKGLVDAADFRSDAVKYIDDIDAKGGTNINEALSEALAMKSEADRPISFVFITDGLPTVGETDIGKIITYVTDRNKNQIKIFTFGVGYDVNTVLLDQIAAASRAVSDYIEPSENIEQKISSFYDKISHPVLTNLSFDYGGIEVDDVFPKKMPDLFKGSQLTILGRYHDEKKGDVKLTGRVNDNEKTFSYEADYSKSSEQCDFLPHLWATRKIGYLMDEIRLHGENKELKDEIIRLSKKYGVMSPYTSFLVQEEMPLAQGMSVRPDGGNFRRMEKKSVDYNMTGGIEAQAPATPPMDQGAYAVKYSKASREMKEKESGLSKDTDFIKRIGDRTFYWQDSLWVDSEYQNEKTIDIKYGSQADLDLILKYPEMAKFMALGERVIFQVKGKYVKISETGKEKFVLDEIGKLFR